VVNSGTRMPIDGDGTAGSTEVRATGALRVALVDDDRKLRDALRMLIDGTPGYACVADFRSVEDSVHSPTRETPDVVLLDINLPGVSGSEGVALVQQRFPGAVILMLTVFEDKGQVFRSLCNGASGYILKKTPPARLLEYIREAAGGGAPMSPEIANKVIRLFRTVAPARELDVRPTEAETKLLALLAEGYSYEGAAEQIGVTINTVRDRVRSIYDKLHVHSKSEAVAKALRAGLI
jgi:DNA-binding NarL/FixJ family response regulator